MLTVTVTFNYQGTLTTNELAELSASGANVVKVVNTDDAEAHCFQVEAEHKGNRLDGGAFVVVADSFEMANQFVEEYIHDHLWVGLLSILGELGET